MKNRLSNWVHSLFAILSGAGLLVADPSAKPPPVRVEYAHGDPKSTCQNYLEAVKRADLDAALKCWEYRKEDSAAMNVVVGIWIAHRRLNQAVANKFKAKESLNILDGWLRDDLTDEAIALTEKLLLSAKAEYKGDNAILDMKWQDVDTSETCFRFPEQPTLRKIGGSWKMSVSGENDVLEKGTWGPLIRDTMNFLNEAADKVNKGEFKTVIELKKFLDTKEKAMETRYDRDTQK